MEALPRSRAGAARSSTAAPCAERDLGHRVGEAARVAERDTKSSISVTRLAALGDDQQARMADAVGRRAARELKTRWIGCSTRVAARHDDEGAVVEKARCSARRTAWRFGSACAAEMARERARRASAPQLGEALDAQAPGERAGRRELRREAAVHEDETLHANTGKQSDSTASRVTGAGSAPRQLEARRFASGVSVRVAPLLVLRASGSPARRSAPTASRAQRRAATPGRRAPARAAKARAALGEVVARGVERAHRAAAPREPVVALLLELERELLAAGAHDPAARRARGRSRARCSRAAAGSG